MTETTPSHDPGKALSSRQIAWTASLIMLGLAASGVLGLIRQVAITAAFGAGGELDAFYAALRVPETLFTLVAGGALGSAFIPVFARFLAKDDFSGAWKLASTVLTLVVLGGTLLSVVAFVFAEPIVENILQPGKDADAQALTIELMRIMLLTVMIFGASGLVMGILNGYQNFLTPAFAPSMYNIGIIIGALLLEPMMGIRGLAWGVVLGSIFHLIIQLPALWTLPYRSLRPQINWQTPGVSEVMLLMGPRVLGLGIVQINFWVNAALTSNMADGSLAALSTAFMLMFVVLGILGQSVGTAVFPTLSRLYAEGEHDDFWQTLTRALNSVLFLSIPAGFGLAALANPVVTVLYERGEFTTTDSAGTAWALALFSVGLAGHTALEILARAFYALHDTWTPVKIGGLTMILNIILSIAFIYLMGYPDSDNFAQGPFGGLALSMSIATALESLTLWFLLRRRIDHSFRSNVVERMGRVMLASLVMVAAVIVWELLTLGAGENLVLVGGILIGMAVFWGMALLLRLEEARAIPRAVLGRLGLSQ